MTTAQTPYLNNEVTANASIYGMFLLNIKNKINSVKNKVAVGLSGTNGIKIIGVIAN